MFKFTFIKQTQSQAAPLTVTTESACGGEEVQGLQGGAWVCSALTSHCLCPQNRGEEELQGALHLPWFLNPRSPEGHFSRSLLLMVFKWHGGAGHGHPEGMLMWP